MAKNFIADFDIVPENNTDIGGIDIKGTAAVQNFDNGLRTLMAFQKAQYASNLTGAVADAGLALNNLKAGTVPNALTQDANQLLTAGEYELLNSAANIPVANYGRLRVEVFQNYIRQTFMPFAGGTPESMNCFFTRSIILSSPNLFGSWAGHNDYRRLAAANGYRTMPDGTIEQWGSTTVTGSLVISFPLAFAALPYSVVCTPYNNSTAANVMVAAHAENITATGFLGVSRVASAGSVAPGNFNVQWRAVGK